MATVTPAWAEAGEPSQMPFALQSEIFRYIEASYNPHRRHSGIGHRSPVNFEKSYYEAA